MSTDANGVDTLCRTRSEIEDACKNEAVRRFSQANATPFMTEPLLSLLGYNACQATVDAILTGNFVPPEGTDEYTIQLIQQLRMPDSVLSAPCIDGILRPTEHIQGWHRMKGKIASSPFGPSFADYIAGADDLEVAQIDTAFANIPLHAGFTPEAWTQALDMMIPKKVSSTHVRKLRIIVLFHALFNMLNKRVGRAMIQQADSLNLIPEEAYGSRPGRRANICALNKVLATDLLRQLKKDGIICSNDATSCYDRIVHAIASICMQRLGVTPEVCKIMLGTLQELQHFVTTAFGICESSYGAIHVPLQGIGQGNGAGPAIWLVMTIPLIQMLRSRGFGLRHCSPLSHEELFISCFTFVDDSDTIIAPLQEISTEELLVMGQKALDTWNGGLVATGGALSLDKTHWWLISFAWNHAKQRWQYSNPPGTLFLRSDNGSDPIPRLPASEAKESLGVWIAMDGNQERMIEALTAKIDKWAFKIAGRQLTKYEAWVSLTSGISKSLTYPLVATRLRYKDCTRITKSLRTVATPALGLSKNFPHAVLHAPRRYMGYGMLDLWFEQGFVQMDSALHHSRLLADSTGAMLRSGMEGIRVELGLPGSPFSYNYFKWSDCTTPVYLHTLWEVCSSRDWILKDHLPDEPVQRIGDVFLMEAFGKVFSPKQLAILNGPRIVLGVKFLSDIVTGDGRCLQPGILDARKHRGLHSHIRWPRAGTPNAHAWRLWRDALQHCFLVPAPDSQMRLLRPLGSWTIRPHAWPHYYRANPPTLFMAYDQRYLCCQPLSGRQSRGHRQRFTPQGIVSSLPIDATPTTAHHTRNGYTITGTSEFAIPIQQDISDDQWWGVPYHIPEDLSPLTSALRSGTLVAVTDGSCKDNRGTAAYSIRTSLQDATGDLICVNETPGLPAIMDSYRAELAGIYGILRTVNMLADRCSTLPHTAAVEIGCDCKSAIDRLREPREPHPHTAHFDLLSAARYELTRHPIQWSFRHIRGHMDSHTRRCQLSPWELLNCQMDDLAKSFWDVRSSVGFTTHQLPGSGTQWTLWAGSYRVTAWTRAIAEDMYYGNTVHEYWTSKLKLRAATVDWHAIGKAFRNLPTNQQLWIPRWFTSRLSLRSTLWNWGLIDNPMCPRCPAEETDRFHVLRCPQVDATAIFNQQMDRLSIWLLKQHTHPVLREGLLSQLRTWRTGMPWLGLQNIPAPYQQALDAQWNLGPSALIDGMVHWKCVEIQQRYYAWLRRRRTGFRWHVMLIRQIWQIAWDLWKHRLDVLHSPDSLSLARSHELLNDRIEAAFARDRANFPTAASRWFSRSPRDLYLETLDYKKLWLEAVSAF
jgi:hypothetical protein